MPTMRPPSPGGPLVAGPRPSLQVLRRLHAQGAGPAQDIRGADPHASPHWNARRIRARHGVVLPHSSAPPGDLGADMPQRIFCFAERFEDGFRDWILEQFGDAPPDEGRTKELGRDGIQALKKILAKPFQLRTPLGTVLSRNDAALQVLTRQQSHILRTIEAVPRAAISGGAGTGKTVLAMEEARYCAEFGARTLFVCYNRGQVIEVRHRLGGCWTTMKVTPCPSP